ncbi:arylsulfatase [Catalinimonas niigatensis]|uniref:arylsulfatase n=1 Tax=Catalinimonas niigatensis TaxID=1397264 RepID=UPI002665EFC5|nr:arylsulfatase [Catalinimonas niigatensis]WPP49208.1 arylsulfatase [Catalinimonas niigatensis]
MPYYSRSFERKTVSMYVKYSEMCSQALKIILMLIMAATLGSACTQQPQEQESTKAADKPNIVIIMADDMGYSDIGSYGGEIATPNLDALAENGLRFRQFYNAARCCPTRASLLTGLYPHEAGMGGMVSNVDSQPAPGPYQGFLNNSSVTIAEVLKQADYATYMSGKWHVGEKPEHWPRQRGFDRYFGLISGASSYFEIIKEQPRVRQMVLDDQPWAPPADGFYMTDAFTNYAVSFLDEHFQQKEEQPFLLYLAYTAPHWPLHALPEDIQKYEGKYALGWDSLRDLRYQNMLEMGIIDSTYALAPREEGVAAWENAENKEDWARRMAVYAAMIDRMDQGIGKVVNTLKQNNAWDNTLILFLSDNGGCAEDIAGRGLNDPSAEIGYPGSYVAYQKPWAIASNTPFRRYKQWVNEGGIATPLIAHWPEGIAASGIAEGYAHVTDIMVTCLEAAKTAYPANYNGKSVKALRGKSLLPVFEGEAGDEERTLYWEHFGHQAVRKGKWKIVANAPDYQWQLFDMDQDPTELEDVSSEFQDITRTLAEDYQSWADEVGVKKVKP